MIGLVLLLLLPTPTIWLSLDHKRNVSDGVVSGIGTLFSLDHKLYASDYDSDSVASENHPLEADLVFIFFFCYVLSRFYSCERIHDPVSVTRIAFNGKRLGFRMKFLKKQFVCQLLFSVCSFITLVEKMIVRHSLHFILLITVTHHFCEDAKECFTIFSFGFSC